MPRPLTATAVTAAASLVLLAGCGGSSSSSSANFKPGYESAMKALSQPAAQIGTTVEGARNESDAQLEAKFKALAGQWKTASGQLDKLTAPSSVSTQFSALKSAASRVEGDLNAIASAASTHNGSSAKTAAQHLVADLTAGKSTDVTIRKKLGLPAAG
jgi:hypothetical protein